MRREPRWPYLLGLALIVAGWREKRRRRKDNRNVIVTVWRSDG